MPSGPPPYKPPKKKKTLFKPHKPKIGPKKAPLPGRLPGRPKLGYKPPQQTTTTKAPRSNAPPHSSPRPTAGKSYKPSFSKVGGTGPSPTGALPKPRPRKGPFTAQGQLKKPTPPKNPYR